MKIRGNLLRVLFGVNLLFFVFCTLSPWASKTNLFIWRENLPYPIGGDEFYWSFQSVFYPYRSGYKNLLISWDFWFGPHERIVLLDYWFSQGMYYYGFSYDWIRIFIFQLLTLLSGIWVLFKKWQKTTFMLVPITFSVLSVFIGLLVVARFMFVWRGYANIAWGLPFALFSTLFFVVMFSIRYGAEKKKPKLSV